MPRTARPPHEWLTLGAGLLAGLEWSSLALRAVLMDQEPSVRALFACAALVLVGFVGGVMTWILAAPRRAKRPPSEVARQPEPTRPFAMLALVIIGSGAFPIVDASEGAWGWVLMVPASLVGGLLLGVVFGQSTDRASALRVGQPG